MALFQKSVINKYIAILNKEALKAAWIKFQAHFHDATIQNNIRDAKEEEYQEGFVRDLFVNILGYTLKPQPNYNFVLEKKTETDATKSDGALLCNDNITGVVELKDTGTTQLDKIEKQVFGYKHKHKNCVYAITSNFEKLRFYINDSTDFEEFNLFVLTEEHFTVLYLCLQQQQLQNDVPLIMKQASVSEEENVTKKLYADYSGFKKELFTNISALNPHYDKLELFKKTQKLLDRLLFILFAEDRGLLPPNSVREILNQWQQLKELDNYVSLYSRFIKYFGYLNTGHSGKQYDIFAYNGGLFAPDEILDNIKIDDALLHKGGLILSKYDFDSEVDVNILGHIFEHSLGEIEEVQAELEGTAIDKTKTKRKKDGVFYTPRYITKYIVENTVGALCSQQKHALGIQDDAFTPQKRKANTKQLKQKLDDYRQWLLQITICDPACGSGAFLNQALEFLIAEHRLIDELTGKLFGDAIVLSDVENSILENNIFGVDINDEAVEIARLSLWLRTARKGRKLNSLSENIKVGNSLIDDPAIAGDKAFNWQKEFPQIFGGYQEVEKVVEELVSKTQHIETGPAAYIPSGEEQTSAYSKEKITNNDNAVVNADFKIVNEPAADYSIKKQQKDGFDVVIGNPPYVDIKALPQNIVEHIFNKFLSANNRINLFSVFIERSLQILKEKGKFSFIIPSAILTQESYKALRNILLYKTALDSIVRLPNESFGGGAGEVKVDTIILTFTYLQTQNTFIEIFIYKGFERIYDISSVNTDEHSFIDQQSWKGDESKIFRINTDKNINDIVNKIENKTVGLVNCADFCLGLTPYDKYKGHTTEQIENRVFHASYHKDSTYKKLLAGNDVTRYNVNWNGTDWISYGSWLGAPRESRFFKEKRILVKQIIDWTAKKIWAALSSEELYNTQNAFNLIPRRGYEAEYLLVLLNSTLISFYHRKKFLEEYKDRFQKILIKDCKLFPIKSISQQDQYPFIVQANIMLSKNKELHHLKQQLQQLLMGKYSGLKLNNKLTDWPSLNFNDFLKELTKQKIKLSLAEEGEWMQYFQQQKGIANDIQQLIDATDKEINKMVYSLYELTDEEIKIVEGT